MSRLLAQPIVQVIIRVRRNSERLGRVFLQIVHNYLDCTLKLRIVTRRKRLGIVFNFYIRCDTLILNIELTRKSVKRSTRRSHRPAIKQHGKATNPD